MNDLKYADNCTFKGYSLRRSEYEFLVQFTRRNNIRTVLEFGPGASTWAFLENDISITSYEQHRDWYEIAASMFEPFPNVHLTLLTDPTDYRETGTYDMVLVDATIRLQGPTAKKDRREAVQLASEHSDLILLHDIRRPNEWLCKRFLKRRGYRFKIFNSLRGIGVFYKNRTVVMP